jgi:hypothetical protein
MQGRSDEWQALRLSGCAIQRDDIETQNYLYRRRCYGAQLGCFLSRDPANYRIDRDSSGELRQDLYQFEMNRPRGQLNTFGRQSDVGVVLRGAASLAAAKAADAGSNLYELVASQPIDATDPTGLASVYQCTGTRGCWPFKRTVYVACAPCPSGLPITTICNTCEKSKLRYLVTVITGFVGGVATSQLQPASFDVGMAACVSAALGCPCAAGTLGFPTLL